MRILHCIAGLTYIGAGPANALLGLAGAQGRLGHDVVVETLSSSDTMAFGTTQLNINLHPSQKPRVLGRSSRLRRRLLEMTPPNVYHGHGLWGLPVSYMARAARSRGCPYLIAAHGMLEPWALRRSRWKKQLVGKLFQDQDLNHADCLHAITPCEVDSFRAYGLKNPIAIVPNGIDLPSFANVNAFKGHLADLFPATRDRPLALFFSRLHPKKGLLHLVDAWARVQRENPDWILVLSGEDHVGHGAEVNRRVIEHGIQRSVVFTGPLYAEAKLAAFAASKLLVLPSFSEGFSMAVLEAMACGLPVLITHGCNFPEVARAGAGVIVQPTASETEQGLRDLMGLTDNERSAIGRQGSRLVEEQFTWDAVAARMISVYEWLLTGHCRPEFVV